MHDDESREHRLVRLYLKRQARRARRKGETTVSDEIETLLGEPLAVCALACRLEQCCDDENRLIGAGGFPFLLFLLTNFPQIMEMIRELIKLFQDNDA